MFFLCKEGVKNENLPQEVWQPESQTERAYVQECSFENTTYHVGEFVYVEPSEPNLKLHVVCIERLWEDEAGTTHHSNFHILLTLSLAPIEKSLSIGQISYFNFHKT